MVEIHDGRLGKGVLAACILVPGEVVLRGWGDLERERSKHSIQVERDAHVVIAGPIALLNHSCEPNCGVLIRRDDEALEIHALRRIEPGEELTIDYATFEAEVLHMPAECLCGSRSCRGEIRGYWDLPPERRAAYGPYVAPYLREQEAQVSRAG